MQIMREKCPSIENNIKENGNLIFSGIIFPVAFSITRNTADS
jgi:hypothetical protein